MIVSDEVRFFIYIFYVDLGLWFKVGLSFFCLMQQDITETCCVSDKALEEQERSAVEADEERFVPITRVWAGQDC